MFPSILSAFDRKSRKRSVGTTGILEYFRETSPDALDEEVLKDFERYLKTKLDLGSSLPLLKAFARRVRKAKPKLDTKDPTDDNFLQRAKRKRQQFEDEYQYTVDRQNEALLERLLEIRRTRGKLDNWNPNYQPKFDKNKAYRRRMRDKIDVENKQMLRRLHNSKSQYNRSDWDKSFARHQRYQAILQKRRKPWQVRSYRELGGAFILNSPRKKRKIAKKEIVESSDYETSTEDDTEDDDDGQTEKNSDDERKSCLLPEITSAKSRARSRGTMSAKSKDEEPLKLPPLNGDEPMNEEQTKEEPKVEELDDYQKLVKAIEDGDKSTVLDIIAQTSWEKKGLDELHERYDNDPENEKDLVDVVKSTFEGENKDALLALLLPKPQYEAMCLHNALKGMGTDEDTLVEILGSRSNAEIAEIKQAYEKEYNSTLEDDIKASTSDGFQKFLLHLSEGARDENPNINKKAMSADTKDLLKSARTRKWATDEDAFAEIFSQRSLPQLKALLPEYKKSAKVELEETIEKQTTGELQNGSKTMLKIVRNHPKYLAEKLHEALHDGDEVNYETLSRLLNTSDKNELKAAKAAYEKAYGTRLEDDIKAKCNEDMQKLFAPVLQDDGAPAVEEEKKKGKKKKGAKKGKEEQKVEQKKEEENPEEQKKEKEKENAEDVHLAKYRGTVVPAANFDAMKDVEFVRGALVYKDRDGVIKRLTSRSNQQRQVIAKKFNIRYKQDLVQLLKSEFGVTLTDAIDALMAPPSVQDARTLHEAMGGLGTKEKDLIDIICFRRNKDITAFKESYEQEFQRNLEDDVRNETSGDFGDFLIMLLQAKRSESNEVNESDVKKDAKALLEASEDQLGTDEEAIAEILTSRSRPHLNAVFAEFKQIADRDFTESMMSELSGDLLKAVLAVVSNMSGAIDYYAEKTTQILSDDKALTNFIASRSEIDMADIKEAYSSQNGRDLGEDIQKKHKGNRRKILLGLLKEEDPTATGPKNSRKKKGKSQKESEYHPTVTAAKHFSSGRDAELIKASLGVDTDAIIMVIAARSNKQRQEIVQKYQMMYEKDLIKQLTSIFGSGSEAILKPLFTSPDIFEATQLKESMEGAGTDEDVLISAICLKNNEGIAKLKESFQKVVGKSLVDVVESETSGDFRTLLLRLLQGKRDEKDTVDQKIAEQDAKALHQAGVEKKFGTDESTFIEIFSSRSKASLKATFEEYKKIAECDISESLSSELSGNFEKAMVLIANSCQHNSPLVYAKQLQRVKDISREFAFYLSNRAEVDMVEIKTTYSEEFKETLMDEIMIRYENDQKNLLMALIKEWKQGRKDITQPPGQGEATKYHPTVPPAINFNASNDAESIQKTQSSAFDMDEVIMLLVRRTVQQRNEIASEYKTKYEKDLVKELEGELAVEPSLIQALFENPADIVVKNLQKATKGVGTDEKTLLGVICSKTNKEIEEIKKSYFAAVEEELSDVVAKETSGKFQELLLEILKAERNESPEVVVDDVNEDAKALYKAGDKKWGTDEGVFVDIFSRRSHPHLKAVFKEFKKLSKRDITESLRAELSGDILDALLLIASVSEQGELTPICSELKGKLSEKNDFMHLVIAHSEVDMVEVKEEYKKQHQSSLADDIKKTYEGNLEKILLGLIKEWKPFAKTLGAKAAAKDGKDDKEYHPTVTPAGNFNAGKDADTLFNANGKDTNVTIMLLAARIKDQRKEIRKEYEKKYNVDLLEDISGHLNIKRPNLIPLFETDHHSLAQSLHSAMKGFGTDEKALIDILCVQDNKNIKELSELYEKEYGKALADAISSETGGELKNFLLEILQADRRENQPASEKQAVSDATALYEAGEKKWGTDESKFIKILTSRSRTHLRQVLVEYKKIANKDLVDSLKDELTGDLEYALITLVSSIKTEGIPHSCNYLKQSLGNSTAFTTSLSHRAEIDTVEIKEEYNKMFSTPLASDISQNFTGNFSSLLLALIKEWNPQPSEKTKKKGEVDGNAATQYHPTVTPAKPFNPVKDSDVIRKAIGKDKQVLIEILSSRTIEQRQAISTKYKERFNKANLSKLLCKEFGSDFEDILPGMFANNDLKLLNEAVKETNEKALYRIICQKSEKDLQKMKSQYKKAYGHALSEKISEKFKGDLKSFIIEILKCERSENESVDQKIAQQDAQGLHQAGEKKDSAKIIHIFTNRSISQLKAMLEEYKKLSEKDDIPDDLLDSTNASKALTLHASFLKDPLQNSAIEIKQSMLEDPVYCKKLIATHAEIDMVEIKDVYQNFNGETMEEDIIKHYNDDLQTMLLALVKEPIANPNNLKKYHPTVSPVAKFNSNADSDALKNAKDAEHDIDGIISLLCSRTKEQRNKIKEEFLANHKTDLIQHLVTTLKVKERYLKTLFFETSSSKAKMLYEAMKGFGTDEKVLSNVLCAQDNEGLKSIASSYNQEYGKELSDAISSETGGDFEKLLLRILKADRAENQPRNTSKVQADAKELQEAGVEKTGTDEMKFIEILVSRSRSHLQKVFEEYKKNTNQEIEQSIKSEMSGDLEDALLALVASARLDPEIRWSKHLNGCLGRPQEMFECVVERSEIDMVEIKEEYNTQFNVTLADDIKKNYTGNTSKILLALIKEFSFSPKPPATKASNRAPRGRAGKATKPAPSPQPKAEEVPSSSLYHGTVVPVEKFVVANDVKSLHTSIGKNKKAVIQMLGLRSTAQRQNIMTSYKETHKKDLVQTLKEMFVIKNDQFLPSLFVLSTMNDVKALQDAMKGLGTKESVLIDVLCQRSEQEILELKTQFQKAYKKALDKTIDSEADDDFGKLLLEILKCDRDDSTIVDAKLVLADAKGLHEAGEKKQGTDEAKFIETLTSRSDVHLIEMYKEYEKIAGKPLDQTLKDEFSGDIGMALSTMVSYQKGHIAHFASKLNTTVESNIDSFSRLVVARCEIDMVEIKEVYSNAYQRSLADDINTHLTEEDLRNILLSLIKEWNPDEEPKPQLTLLPEIVYHPTVVMAPDFVAEKDADTVKEELAKSKNAVVDLLTTRTKKQRQEICDVYRKKENEELTDALIREFGDDTKVMLTVLIQTGKSDAEMIHGAMEGFGTKEDILINVLCRRNVQEIEKAKTDYKSTYEKDMEEAIGKETSGDLNKLLIRIIKCERVESDSVDMREVQNDAEELHKAGEEKVGTDESRFNEIFSTRSFGHLRLMFEQYQKISGKAIEDSLKKEFSGDVETAFSALVSHAKDPLSHHVTNLGETIKEDPPAFCRLVVERSEVDMVEVKDLYQKSYLKSLADHIREHYTDDVKNILLALIKEWTPEEREEEKTIPLPPAVVYHPTVVAVQEFVVENDVNVVKSHFGTDKDAIIGLLTTRSKEQRHGISEEFQKKESKVFSEQLVVELGEKSEDILKIMVQPPKSDADRLHEAMEGFGTKEEVLIDILCRRTKDEIAVIKTSYKKKHEKELQDVIEKETSGDLQKLFVELIKCEREEKDVIYPKDVRQDASDLQQAGEKTVGTDESQFINVFTSRSLPHLKMTFEHYETIASKTIEESIKKEFTGEMETALLTMVSYINDPLTSHVAKLNKTIKDYPNTFSQIIVDRSEVDMVEIKESYEKTYKKTLADDIKEHFKEEDVRNILLGLIKEWVPEKQPTIPADPPVVYHATVVAPEKFVEEDDVNELKKHLGSSKNALITLLMNRTREQRKKISDAYQSKENDKLHEKLNNEFDKDSEELVSVLLQPSETDVEKLHGAMEGFGTKEDVLIDILCRRSQQEITLIKEQYKKQYEKDLDTMIEKETGGDLEKLFIEILKCERDEKDTIHPRQVERDAVDLFEAGEKKLGTDETKFVHIFSKRSFPHLKMMFEEYHKTSGKTIEKTLKSEFTGDTETAFMAIVSYVKNPLTSHVGRLKATIEDDKKMFRQLIVERSEIDMVEIKDLYKTTYEVTLADDIKKHYTGDTQNILLALIKEWDPKAEEPVLRAPTPIKYNATVIAVQNFKVDDDVDTIKTSLGNDKNAIITILTTRSRDQREEICAKYEQKHNEDLCPRLTAELGEDVKDALSLLLRPLAINYAAILYDAMKGFGTREELLITVLCRRSPEEIQEIKAQYQKSYSKDLGGEVDDETSGDLNKLLVELIKCDREPESAAFNAQKAVADAENLYKAGEKSWGTDESQFIEIFTKRSFTHLRAVFEHYKKISGNDIVNALNSEMDGHLLAAFLALVSSARNPPTYYAGLAKKIVTESPKDFVQLVVERCEIDTVEIKDIYLSVYKKKLAEDILANFTGILQRMLLGLLDEPWEKLAEEAPKMESEPVQEQQQPKEPKMKTIEKPLYHGTIKPAPPFNPKEYAEKLKKAMKGFGTDEKTIVQVLSSRSNEQRRTIYNTYQQEFKKDLIEELKSELGGDMENLVVAMMLPSDVFHARELDKAMKGFGTDEEALCEIICGQTSEGLEAVVNCYKREKGKDLNAAIDGETKDDVQRLLLGLLLSGHLNATEVDMNEVEEAALDIQKAQGNRWQGENAVIQNLLRTKSRVFMSEVITEFQKITKCDIVNEINKKKSGTYKDCLLAAVECIREPPVYFAKRLYNALNKMNVDDDTLIRCVVGRSEVDLLEIKQAFQALFSVSLQEIVKKKCRGDYETLLIALIDGN
ncbi:uncharacterized protein LOC114520254 isoform X2 [Dendronephthya gigantea]|uniref:uncharacterized protein LOC114520254 isoform X2 n=1 Tax=Dendronephthya gigantea TaxID=151771 RepID=UPI0010698F6A|nr:uncharacterized protein LOC114520254 isoform X2 [Dendronephthya gigantea]